MEANNEAVGALAGIDPADILLSQVRWEEMGGTLRWVVYPTPLARSWHREY